MQIDLANTLVCKVYFVYHALFIISPQARAPLPWEGLGVGFLPSLGRGWGWAFEVGLHFLPFGEAGVFFLGLVGFLYVSLSTTMDFSLRSIATLTVTGWSSPSRESAI